MTPLDILAPTSKAVGFTPTTAGDYAFSVSFSKNGGASQTLTKSITMLRRIKFNYNAISA